MNNITNQKEVEENLLFVELEKNIAAESVARGEYYEFLAKFGHLLTNAEREDFREIISEELKHTEILNQMIFRRNGIVAE